MAQTKATESDIQALIALGVDEAAARRTQIDLVRVINQGGTNSGSSTSASLSRSTSTTDYEVQDGQSGTGYSAGQKLRRTVVRDISVTPSTLLETLWENLDTLQALASAPNPLHLEPLGDDTETALAAISGNTAPGTKIAAATMPAGGTGPLGWLSAIWQSVSAIGSASDAAAATDTADTGLISLIKRSMLRLSNIHLAQCTGAVLSSSAVNANVLFSIPAPPAGFYNHIDFYLFGYDREPDGPKSGLINEVARTLIEMPITNEGPGPVPLGISVADGTAATCFLEAGGAGVKGILTVGYTVMRTI